MFVCSVNLAVSLIGVSRASQPLCPVVSASALLRASNRLQSMQQHGGDVTVSFGALFRLDHYYDSNNSTDQPGQQPSSSPAPRSSSLAASLLSTNFDHFSADAAPARRQRQDSTEPGKENGEEDSQTEVIKAEESPSSPPAPCSSSSFGPSSPLVDDAGQPLLRMAPVCDARTVLSASVDDPVLDAGVEMMNEQRYQPHGQESRMGQSKMNGNGEANGVASSSYFVHHQDDFSPYSAPLMNSPSTDNTNPAWREVSVLQALNRSRPELL